MHCVYQPSQTVLVYSSWCKKTFFVHRLGYIFASLGKSLTTSEEAVRWLWSKNQMQQYIITAKQFASNLDTVAAGIDGHRSPEFVIYHRTALFTGCSSLFDAMSPRKTVGWLILSCKSYLLQGKEIIQAINFDGTTSTLALWE